jgi:two-component system response regulator WspF
MDGVESTRRIMARTPCAIVVVTADVNYRSSKVFEAMGAGALDAVNTPVLEHPGARGSVQTLLRKIETIRKLIGAERVRSGPASPPSVARQFSRHHDHLIAIGASAGGPMALAKVLAHLPADFPAPVVIVQHVDAQFTASLANWLGGQTALRVRLARDGDRPERGTVLLAGQNDPLVFAGVGRLAYRREPLDCAYRPSIDLFFKSAERSWPGDVIGVVLTGMGRDGAEGLLALRRNGHHTIAQDRTSSAAFGMPGAAAELHAASEVLALDKIGPRLTNILAQRLNVHG